jgi:hypothetical protein
MRSATSADPADVIGRRRAQAEHGDGAGQRAGGEREQREAPADDAGGDGDEADAGDRDREPERELEREGGAGVARLGELGRGGGELRRVGDHGRSPDDEHGGQERRRRGEREGAKEAARGAHQHDRAGGRRPPEAVGDSPGSDRAGQAGEADRREHDRSGQHPGGGVAQRGGARRGEERREPCPEGVELPHVADVTDRRQAQPTVAQRAYGGARVQRRRGRRAGARAHRADRQGAEQREDRGRRDRGLPWHVPGAADEVRRGGAERERPDHDARRDTAPALEMGRDQPHPPAHRRRPARRRRGSATAARPRARRRRASRRGRGGSDPGARDQPPRLEPVGQVEQRRPDAAGDEPEQRRNYGFTGILRLQPPLCHAGGRGFESRRSRFAEHRNTPQMQALRDCIPASRRKGVAARPVSAGSRATAARSPARVRAPPPSASCAARPLRAAHARSATRAGSGGW